MSKIYSLYQHFKSEDSKIIYLFKSGIFYIAISEDATYLSNKFGFKLTKLNDTILKCGFPISSLDKYSNLFATNNINFRIINMTNYNYNNHSKNNNEIKNLIDELSIIDTESLSISEIYRYLEKIKQKAIKIKNS